VLLTGVFINAVSARLPLNSGIIIAAQAVKCLKITEWSNHSVINLLKIIYMKTATHFTSEILLLIFVLWSQSSFGQSLPQIQKLSIYSPADIKIDGKSTEWNDKFQAYNNADGIWYTLSNDDNNLYLIIKAPYRDAPDKIMTGGITFTVSHYIEKGKRNTATDNVSLKFPILTFKESQSIIISSHGYETLKNDTVHKKPQIDSLVNIVNTKANNVFKEIEVVGIKNIPDLQLSVYNTEGIKAMGQFDKRMNFVYELLVPIKSLRLSIDSLEKFSYSIKINGRPVEKPLPGQKFGINEDAIDPGSDYLYRMSDSNFWSEYTLSKKTIN